MAILKTAGMEANPLSGMYTNGKQLRTVNAQFKKAAADVAQNDIVLLTGAVSADSRLHRVMLPAGSAATAGLSDNDLIMLEKKVQADGTMTYEKIAGATILVDGADFTSAKTAAIDLLGLTLDKTKSLKELAGSNFAGREIYLALEVKSKPTAAVNIDMDLVLEEAY